MSVPLRSPTNESACGQAVANILAGSWREKPPRLRYSPRALRWVTRQLLQTGAGGLGWWRVRGSNLRDSAAGRRLRQAYRFASLEAALREQQIRQVFSRLRGDGVEPLLIKGWAVARLYPVSGLRPFTDIDLCVAPGQMQSAMTTLSRANEDGGVVIDLHEGVSDLQDRKWEELLHRTQRVRLGDMDVRVLGPEDQLRHLCLHLLRHGARRPLWLCDVAVALESQLPDFDWDYCLAGDPRLTEWVVCVLGLAQQLLGARLMDPTVAAQAAELPAWLPATVLELWGADADSAIVPLAGFLRRPSGLLPALRTRWQCPIELLFGQRVGPHQPLPRPLIQLGAFLARTIAYVVHLPRKLLTGRAESALPFTVHRTA
jgi:hypothetical protein